MIRSDDQNIDIILLEPMTATAMLLILASHLCSAIPQQMQIIFLVQKQQASFWTFGMRDDSFIRVKLQFIIKIPVTVSVEGFSPWIHHEQDYLISFVHTVITLFLMNTHLYFAEYGALVWFVEKTPPITFLFDFCVEGFI